MYGHRPPAHGRDRREQVFFRAVLREEDLDQLLELEDRSITRRGLGTHAAIARRPLRDRVDGTRPLANISMKRARARGDEFLRSS